MRKNEELMTIVAVAIVFALMVVPVQAQEGPVSYGGIEFPLGDVSFADKVVGFNPGSRTGESDGSAAIGPPDGGKGTGPSVIGDKGDVTLGNGGSITLEFTDNYLIDVEGLDLYVFEYGPDVEPFKVEISKDGSGWIELGTVRGQPTGLDIHGKVAPGDRFSYVRITDANPYAPRDPKIIGQSSYVGADIDAVGAIGAEERPDSDGNGVPDVTEPPLTPTPTPGTTRLSCENNDNEENGCCCFLGTHTYRFDPQNVTSVVARFDTGRKFDCRSTVKLEVYQGGGWQTIKTVEAVSSSGSSEFAPIEVQVPVNDVISGFRISAGGVCWIDLSEITLYGRGTVEPEQQLKVSDLRGFLNTDNDCNLYVADWSDNQVKMINPDGSTSTHASGIDRPRYQVFDSARNLYVGSFDGNIYKVSASGGTTVVASGIWSPQGMGFDSASNLYVAGGYDGKIHRIAPDGSKTTMDSGFTTPKHLVVYSDGNVYVVGSSGTLILRITPEGGKANLVDLGETVNGMATDGEYFYISHSDKISRIDAFGQVTHIATGLDQPTHLAVCNGNVFVTVRDGIVKTKISDETKTGTCDWTGAWDTDWGRMELQQNGNKVNGTYPYDQGRIQGTVSGRNLTGTWSEYPSYSPPGDAGDMVFIISEDCSSFDGMWRYGTSGGWSGSWTGARISTGSGTSYPEATITHDGFDFSQGNTGEYPTYDGEVIYWQPGAATHPDYPRDSGYLWWRNTHLDDVNFASQTKDMGAVDIATVREVPAEWDKSPLIPPLLMGHTIVAKCYDGYVKFQVISVDPADESARVKYWYSPDMTFDDTIS